MCRAPLASTEYKRPRGRARSYRSRPQGATRKPVRVLRKRRRWGVWRRAPPHPPWHLLRASRAGHRWAVSPVSGKAERRPEGRYRATVSVTTAGPQGGGARDLARNRDARPPPFTALHLTNRATKPAWGSQSPAQIFVGNERCAAPAASSGLSRRRAGTLFLLESGPRCRVFGSLALG